MEKEFIPYKEALALKELGFYENCLARFDGGGFRMLPVYDPLKNNEVKESWFCVTPLYQQAFRWFREKYHIIGYPIFKGGKTTETSWYDYIIYSEIDWENNNPNQQWKTYEEAELSCLRKLIEIVKQK